MSEAAKCPSCSHSEHRGECKRLARSRCTPISNGFICGRRPACPCPLRACRCGALVASTIELPLGVSTAPDGTVILVPVLRGSAGRSDGRLAVRQLADGYLACRGLAADEEPGRGEWRGVEHICEYEPAEVPV